MSGTGTATSPKDARVSKVVKLLSNEAVRGAISIPKAMRAEGFTLKDSANPAKQMWIRRRLPKKTKPPENVPVGGYPRYQRSLFSD